MTCEFQTYLKLLACDNTLWEDAAVLRRCFTLNQQCSSEGNSNHLPIYCFTSYSRAVFKHTKMIYIFIYSEKKSNKNFIYNENKPEDKL